jgi:hypothetical protein
MNRYLFISDGVGKAGCAVKKMKVHLVKSLISGQMKLELIDNSYPGSCFGGFEKKKSR